MSNYGCDILVGKLLKAEEVSDDRLSDRHEKLWCILCVLREKTDGVSDMYPSSPSSFSGAGLILLSAGATRV
jgi:hypothetical protein